jgi:hypothetical protein
MGDPIAGYGKSFQMEVYRRFHNPMEAKELFLQLARRDGESFRLGEGLSEWIASDSPETWDAWWQTHRED